MNRSDLVDALLAVLFLIICIAVAWWFVSTVFEGFL